MTGDIHEEVENHNRLLDKVVGSSLISYVSVCSVTCFSSELFVVVWLGEQNGLIKGNNVGDNQPFQVGLFIMLKTFMQFHYQSCISEQISILT